MDGSAFDRDEGARTLALFEGGRRLLESLARGVALATVLDDLCRLVERVAAGCRCTVLLVEPGGARMAHGAAPNLPDTYNRCLAGRPATAESGPCGMAASLRQQVIVHDVAADDRWKEREWASLALAHACARAGRRRSCRRPARPSVRSPCTGRRLPRQARRTRMSSSR